MSYKVSSTSVTSTRRKWKTSPQVPKTKTYSAKHRTRWKEEDYEIDFPSGFTVRHTLVKGFLLQKLTFSGRKIRERIARLQERVIINELRAAAVLNGWDQGYNTPQFPLRPYSGFLEHDVGLSQRDVSPMTQEEYAHFIPPRPLFSTQSWPTDINSLSLPQSQPLVYSGDFSHFSGTSAASTVFPLISMPAQSNNCMPPYTPGLVGDTFRELESRGDCLIQKTLPISANQPLYYVATGEFSVDWNQ
jgi:hypothetical protein